MRALKIVVWLVMVLVVLAVGLVLVATNLIDPNEYKPKISQLVEDKTGRKLDLQGDLELTFFPWIGVETGKLSLSNAAGFAEAPMVAVDNALVKVKLLPLLKKQVEVDTVVLDAPNIRLQTLADGRTNWDDLVASVGGESVPEEPAAQGAGAIAGLAIQGISISDGVVQWQNDQAEQSLTLENLDLSTGSLVPGDPLDISLSVNASGNMIPEPAAIKLDTTVTLSENMAAISLASTALNVGMKTINADLSVEKVSYALEAGLAAVNGLTANLEKDGIKSDLAAESINFNLSDETLELPSLRVKQDDVSISAAVSAAGVMSSPTASGKFDVKAADVAAFLSRNGIEVAVPDFDLKQLKQLDTQGSFDYRNDTVKLDGFNFSAMVNALQTTIVAPSFSYNLKSASVSAPSFQISQGDFSFKGDVEGSELLSDSRKLGGQVNLAITDVAELLTRNGLKIELPEIPLQNIKLNTQFDLSGTLVTADALSAQFDHQQQPTEISVPRVKIDLDSGALDLASATVTQGDFSLQASAKGSGVTGDLDKMNASGTVKAATPDLPGLLARNALDVEIPEGMLTALSASLGFKVADNNASVNNLDAKIDDMTVKGSVGLTNLSKPRYKFDLAINQLDVDSLVGGDGAAESAEKPSTSEQLLLPVAALRGLNVDGKAKIGTLITTGLTLKDVNITVQSDENVLRVAPLTAKAFGGNIETQLAYDVSKDIPAIRLVNKVDNVDVGAMLQALEISEKISGTGNLTTNLSGQGADADAVVASLNGDIGFRLLDGALKGYDLQAALLKLETQISQLQGGESTSRATPAAETKFAELSGSFKVKNGVFRNDDLDMKAPLFRVSGRGAMDLPKSRIDYKLDVNVVESVEGQGGKSLSDLKGARIPLKIYGSLNDPSYTLDVAELLKDQATKALKKKLLEQIAPAGSDTLEGGSDPAQIPDDPEEAIKEQLKKQLEKSLLKGLGLG